MKYFLTVLVLFFSGKCYGQYTLYKEIDSVYEFQLASHVIKKTNANTFAVQDTNYLTYFLKINSLKHSISALLAYVHHSLIIYNNNASLHNGSLKFALFIDPNKIVHLKLPDSILKTSELSKQYSGLHFNAYPILKIDDDKNIQNTLGLWGLLKELSAVTQGCIFAQQAFPLLDSVKYCSTSDFYYNSLGHFYSYYLSYYRFLILSNSYIEYLEVYRPEQFQFIDKDTALQHAIKEISKNFGQCLEGLAKHTIPVAEKKYYAITRKKYQYDYQSDIDILIAIYQKNKNYIATW